MYTAQGGDERRWWERTVELEAGKEEVVHIKELLPVETDVVAHDFGKTDEALVVEAVGRLQAQAVHVAGEVVKFVRVDAVLRVGDDVVQKGRAQRRRALPAPAGDEVGDMADVRRLQIDGVRIDEMAEHHSGAGLVQAHGVCGHTRDGGEKDVVEEVGIRAMAEVVAQACELDEGAGVAVVAGVVVLAACVRVARVGVEAVDEGGREVGHAQAVLEAVVARAREDEVVGAQLLEVAQALHVRRVDAGEGRVGELEVAVDGVLEDWEEGGGVSARLPRRQGG